MNDVKRKSVVIAVDRFATVVSKWDYKKTYSTGKSTDVEEKFSVSGEECEHSENTDDSPSENE